MTDELDLERKPRPPKKEPKVNQYRSPDGFPRPDQIERELNECFALVFRGPAGEKAIAYLRSITINHVMEPGTGLERLSYQEGARWLMGVIDKRKRLGEEKKP